MANEYGSDFVTIIDEDGTEYLLAFQALLVDQQSKNDAAEIAG